jgi:cytochrome c-type biogenesis protein CcmH
MALWFVLGLMTLVAAFAVLWPLSRAASQEGSRSEMAIYRDQLAEVERDLGNGAIASGEAEAARVEVSRRLLAASRLQQAPPLPASATSRRAVAIAALVALPLLSAALYLNYGSPEMVGVVAAPAPTAPAASARLDQLVGQVQQHLERDPRDGRGWEVLAPVLFRLGRYDDAVQAFRNALGFNGETAARHSNLGEAMTGAANGVITIEANAEFERAHELDAGDVKARYFLGLAAEQDGRRDDAVTAWQALLNDAPPAAPWRASVEQALASLSGKVAPDIPDDDVVAARSMSDDQRATFVRGMVERLATRLKQHGDDFDGWVRLIRAYMVLGDRDKAIAAAGDARHALAGDSARLQTLNDQLKQFGLGG